MERFEKKIKKEDCWVWIGAKNQKGYGLFRISGGKTIAAHRFSYLLYNGEIGEMNVLHKCDNPSCVNPKHLFLGTNQDNVDDKMKKGRHNCRRVLSDKQVEEIRETNVYRGFYRDFAKKFGVSDVAILQIKQGIRRAKMLD